MQIKLPPIIFSFLCFSASAQYFTKVTNSAIALDSGDSRSVNWVDVNNDGFIDCFISNGQFGGQNNNLYLNNGAGGFTKVMNDTIVKDGDPSDGATFADVDNDGDLDAFVANWYGINNLMYTNDGVGNFTKVGTGIQVSDLGYSETAAWGDYDKDGFVDLYVCNSAGNRKNFLYHSNGDGTYTKITTGTIVNDQFFSRCANWTDIDNDGDLDMFVSNENNNNENIYRNDGSGTFVKLTAGPLLTNGDSTMSGSWADYDNDGDLDVFLANDRSYNALFRNDGNFVFVKVAADTVSRTRSNSFSSAWSDVDNDGDQDLFVTNSFAGTQLLNYFYINNGDGTFTRNSSDAITTDLAWSYGCAFGDYDNDGFEDLAVATCRYNNIDRPHLLYHNNTNSNHWATFLLTGTISNRSAIGARIYVKAAINGNPVWQMREISAQSSYCGQNDMRAHFGLGNATSIDSVKITWPLGLTEYYTGIAADQFVGYVEGATVGIKENSKKQKLQLFPNPADQLVTVSYAKEFASKDKIIILTMEGKVVAEIATGEAKQVQLDIKKYNLKPGAYTIMLVSGNTVASDTLIVK
ncbi:MAG TPA: FG-GAP-like repeat-containing protein [Bacteroidia bacterium]